MVIFLPLLLEIKKLRYFGLTKNLYMIYLY